MASFSQAAKNGFQLTVEAFNSKYHVHEDHSEQTPRYQLRSSPIREGKQSPVSPIEIEKALWFTDPVLEDTSTVPEGNNSPWARARRSPVSEISFHPPTETNIPALPMPGQIWVLIYALFSVHPSAEFIRLKLNGPKRDTVVDFLLNIGLAIKHPSPSAPPGQTVPASNDHVGQLVASRTAFWQGAGSYQPKPAWLITQGPDIYTHPPTSFLPALEYTFTTRFPDARVYARHPIRPAKPAPGSTIYSRTIPHLNEQFSMVALDWKNEKHVELFHNWQNDPRVAQGWNETGTLEEHREYLRKTDVDPHQFAVLGKFNDEFFAYFEIYWAKEDPVGAYYDAQDYDRGRHLLVGDARFRGPHRVKAWHTCLTHYMFLDDPRTNVVVGEPRATNAKILAYDQANGYNIEKFIDLPHKRAALIMSTRERFFQLCPFNYEG